MASPNKDRTEDPNRGVGLENEPIERALHAVMSILSKKKPRTELTSALMHFREQPGVNVSHSREMVKLQASLKVAAQPQYWNISARYAR